MSTRTGGRSRLRVYSVRDGAFSQRLDELATEEPLEIRLEAGGKTVPLAVTMRTPGDDYELVAGYLYSEGVVQSRADLPGLSHCIDPTVDAEQRHNIVNARLRPGLTAVLRRLDRHVFQSSACGVCGKASLEQLETRACPAPVLGRPVPYEVVLELPAKLRAAQGLFAATGGLHAAGLFSAAGELLARCRAACWRAFCSRWSSAASSLACSTPPHRAWSSSSIWRPSSWRWACH